MRYQFKILPLGVQDFFHCSSVDISTAENDTDAIGGFYGTFQQSGQAEDTRRLNDQFHPVKHEFDGFHNSCFRHCPHVINKFAHQRERDFAKLWGSGAIGNGGGIFYVVQFAGVKGFCGIIGQFRFNSNHLAFRNHTLGGYRTPA